MTKKSLIPRLAALAFAALLGAFALGASALAQPAPPHQFYGTGLNAGDTVGLGDMSAEADANGDWFIKTSSDVAKDVTGDSFTLNGEAATATLVSKGVSLTEVTNLMAVPPPPPPEPDPVCPDDGMMSDEDSLEGDDSMMSDDDDSMMSENGDDSMMSDDGDSMEPDDSMSDGDDSMMSDDAMLDCPEEGDEDDGMMDDGTGDDAMLDEDVGMPATGTGGLADGGISAGLIGLLIALGAAAVAGLGIRRVRNRA